MGLNVCDLIHIYDPTIPEIDEVHGRDLTIPDALHLQLGDHSAAYWRHEREGRPPADRADPGGARLPASLSRDLPEMGPAPPCARLAPARYGSLGGLDEPGRLGPEIQREFAASLHELFRR
jgi:hypothetical protein